VRPRIHDQEGPGGWGGDQVAILVPWRA
jgi:hypothetical protein